MTIRDFQFILHHFTACRVRILPTSKNWKYGWRIFSCALHCGTLTELLVGDTGLPGEYHRSRHVGMYHLWPFPIIKLEAPVRISVLFTPLM
jgi:hypothetical protein